MTPQEIEEWLDSLEMWEKAWHCHLLFVYYIEFEKENYGFKD
jgi:hypothetical protein